MQARRRLAVAEGACVREIGHGQGRENGGTFLVPSGSCTVHRDQSGEYLASPGERGPRRTFSATSGLRSAAQCITPTCAKEGKFHFPVSSKQ